MSTSHEATSRSRPQCLAVYLFAIVIVVVIDVFRTWHYLDHAPDTIGEGGVPSIPFYALCCRVGVALVGAIVPLVFRPLRRFFILAMLLIAIAAINSVISLLWQYS